jgi:hypothetical protein
MPPVHNRHPSWVGLMKSINIGTAASRPGTVVVYIVVLFKENSVYLSTLGPSSKSRKPIQERSL